VHLAVVALVLEFLIVAEVQLFSVALLGWQKGSWCNSAHLEALNGCGFATVIQPQHQNIDLKDCVCVMAQLACLPTPLPTPLRCCGTAAAVLLCQAEYCQLAHLLAIQPKQI
jgi:hypothetical protein